MKKLLVLLLAVLMALTLAACGGSSDKEGNTAKTTITIGGSGPLTGPAAVYGTDVYNAAKLAVKEINAKEGKDYFELKFEDDAHDAELAVNAYGVLKDAGMQVSLLCVTTAPCGAVAGMYEEDDIFAITPSGSGDKIPTLGNNVFQMCFKDSNQGIGVADYLALNPELGANVGILYQSTTDYSKGIYKAFVDEAAKKGVNVVCEESFADEQDYSVQLDKLIAAGADCVVLPIYYNEAALILQQADAKDYHPTWFGVDGMDGVLGVENFDASLAEGVYLLYPYTADSSDNAANFTAAFSAEYGYVPTQFAGDAYDCVYALYQACQDGGVVPTMSNSEISAILRDQFTSMHFVGVTADATWGANGEISKTPLAIVIENGEYVLPR